jgi:ABC-type transporter Mla maintaining outer membrane lipid asymmetry ATPase subunit MlaF
VIFGKSGVGKTTLMRNMIGDRARWRAACQLR